MHPITTHYQAQSHVEELHRAAERHRLASQFRPETRMATTIRNATGSWLISAGERLVSRPAIQTAGSHR